MDWAKLNVFQRLVREWDALHPYNAAQAMHVAGRADFDHLNHCWRDALADLGLGALRTAGDRYRFESMNGDAESFRVERVDAAAGDIESFISRELNRRFAPGEFPLRAFALAAGDGASHFMGVVYQHWVADSASIRAVLREWFTRAHDPPAARRRPLRVAGEGYWRSFGPSPGGWYLADGVLASLRWSSRLKRVRRVECPRFDDYQTRFALRRAPEGLVDALLGATRARGATLNDVFLAAVAEVCDRHRTVKRTRRRQDVALGTAVDLRARAGDPDGLADVFGLFLGFTSVVCRPRDLLEWDRLLERVAVQNRLHKQRGGPEASMIRILAAVVAHRLLGPDKVKQFYRKRVPLAGGVSNVNLNDTWVRRYHPAPILDYVRVSPCGPLMPLVFTPTTLGERLNFGLTFRESVVSLDRAAALSATFADRLTRVASSIG
jgi:hypothetical protein